MENNKLALPMEPNKMSEFFASAYNSKDVNNLLNLFEDGAKSVNQIGEQITGKESIKTEFSGLLMLGGTMTAVNKYCIVFEDIALLRGEWKIETKDQSGNEMVVAGSASEVVRKQKDGTWLYVVDHPFGASTL